MSAVAGTRWLAWSQVRVVVGTDLMALTMLKPPGDMGADIAYGSEAVAL